MNNLSGGSSSSKSTTPKTDNRGEFVESGGEELPEETQQPHLEDPTDAPSQFVKSAVNGSMSQIAPLPRGSPRSTSMRKETIGDTISKGRKSRSSRRQPGRHRRTRSEEQAYNSQLLPYYLGPTPQYRMMPAHHESSDNTEALRRGHKHKRVHSDSSPQVPSIPQPNNMMIYPAPGLSPSGNPLIPVLPQAHETGPLLPYASGTPSGSHRKRKSQAAARAPAPVMMLPPPPAPPLYGSFEESAKQPTPPSPRGQPRPYSSDSFSPRNELMSLTGRTPPGSPSPTTMGMKTPPQHPRTPGTPSCSVPASALRTPGGTYRAPDDARVSFSPQTPMRDGYGYSSSGRSPYTLTAGGADVNDGFRLDDSYRDIHHGRKHHRSPHSIRKMHMRQMSAQLFMEDTKGVKQPLGVRDVLFGILFFVHLVGIVYLGRHYSRDALMVNATHGELAINVWYRNVILIAALSGAFAVGLSALTLILMTAIVNKLIQVSLILTIALSFAWGTIGIGVSPRNVVPITGIIALGLSVGYAFVVWDRIPFAAANLKAGFHGVRKNAGTILVAFAFQFLALMWSIYFTFVVIGVYDALLNGDLSLSKHATVFVYTMLFVSYFWTYSVLYVRKRMLRHILSLVTLLLTMFAFPNSACCSSNSGRNDWILVV